MQTKRKILAAACASLALCSCSLPRFGAAPAPVAVASADAYYALGRSHYAASRLHEAQHAYLLALQRDAGHVDARNGLAVLLAERGETAQAIEIWKKLAGEDLAPPDMSLVLGNLAHALSKQGNAPDALTALERAALLNPLDAGTWQQLGKALSDAGEEARAKTMMSQAESLRAHDIRADYALVAASEAPALKLEISNGNGVNGMAADWARRLRSGAWQSVRLTNTLPFAVPRTRIEFTAEREAAAQALAKRIGGASLQKVASQSVDLRIVLGWDQRAQKQMPAQGGQHAP
ncbi:LytR C-terminal domain-containing protein [Massilia endophytica]|uniref:LytR C-terminal domain-containing protein n=1 Tax=Massilia endophytica TaxID=2899220 RepID=UPI001E6254A1|nr:LytR C-terminal domain-containing protein [Massilia endophytica]UGQ46171.1 LytR C-terminal domain-containing protein [Massilia endophytica]